MKNIWLIGIVLMVASTGVKAQFGYGITAKTEIYTRYSNPSDEIAAAGAGSLLLNLGIGPKFWIGGENFSFSAETAAIISPLALSIGDYKGLGAVGFPVMGKFNFRGLSGVNREGKFGWSIGGGLQWSRTELFGVTSKFEDRGISRKLFKTYVAEVGYGFGMSGLMIQGYVRYGRNPDLGANSFSIGISYDFNLPLYKELTDPEF